MTILKRDTKFIQYSPNYSKNCHISSKSFQNYSIYYTRMHSKIISFPQKFIQNSSKLRAMWSQIIKSCYLNWIREGYLKLKVGQLKCNKVFSFFCYLHLLKIFLLCLKFKIFSFNSLNYFNLQFLRYFGVTVFVLFKLQILIKDFE